MEKEVKEGQAVVEVAPLSEVIVQPQEVILPPQMLVMAIQKGYSGAELEKFMDLSDRWEMNEARKAYNLAIANFKSEPVTVVKDKKNRQFKDASYTSKGNLVNTVNAALSPHGLSASWQFDQTEQIRVTCTLTHNMGHSEKVSLSAAPDSSGSKNPIQEMKSTITYLQILTYEAVTGTASVDGSLDDDGNTAGAATVTEVQVADIKALQDEVKCTDKRLLAFCTKGAKREIGSIAEIPANAYNAVIRNLEEMRK